MPALTVFRTFTTKPFAGDDLQIVCAVLGTYRFIQLICLIPLLISILISRFNGTDLYVNGLGPWCEQYELYTDAEFLVFTVDQYEKYEITRSKFSTVFYALASIFMAMDVAWILMVWGTTAVGTPTQPKGRDEHQRKLILFKMFFLNAFPIVLIVTGCLKVNDMRLNNYGCGDGALVAPPPDEGHFYNIFCVLLVTYALEILVFPAIAANKFLRWLRSNKLSQKNRYDTDKKGERLEQCLGGLLKCVSVMCCNKAGGKDLKNQGEMKDFASNLMEFANNDTNLGLVLSDMYVGGKLLARVQAQKRIETIQQLQLTSRARKSQGDTVKEEEEEQSTTEAPADRRTLMGAQEKHRRSILTLQTDADGSGCVVVEKNILTSTNSEDVEVLRNAAHYSIYAQYIYFHVRMALGDLLSKEATTFVRDFTLATPMEDFSFSMFEVPHAHLWYANFQNGIASTPYAILVDEEEKSVVIAVRGTNSLEDWVIDLQYVPLDLEKVGRLCGFDGKGHHCHKGVLTRCKWMYNDIKKQKVLKHLYSSDSLYKDYKLTVVGHSLGGGCAQVLSLMLRPSFPSLKCYAYEPPGCIFDDELAEDCKEFITSIVRHEDVVPRVTQPNLESLRDEYFDVLARIKVSKGRAFHDVRAPCPESHLASRNDRVLCPKKQIEPDTEFYEKVRRFRNERAAKNQTSDVSVKLYIPGNIIHLVDTTGDETKYVPYWASRYEFNSVILSGRMLADHAIPPLVTILRTLNLDDVHEVHTWHSDEKAVDEEDPEVRQCVPFSNPQGRLPIVLVLIAVVASILAALSNQGCKYVSRDTIITPADGGSSYPGIGLKVGLWSYNIQECVGEDCSTPEVYGENADFVDSEFCQPYSDLFDPDTAWKSSRVFGTLSVILGFIGLGLTAIGTCTKLKRRTWMVICSMFLVATLFQGLQLIFLRSDLCTEWMHPNTGETVVTDCSLAKDAKMGVAATVLWFLIAVGCGRMATGVRTLNA
ncbi:hypothetical protein ACHAXT_007261 [Thalassiosira profunda]